MVRGWQNSTAVDKQDPYLNTGSPIGVPLHTERTKRKDYPCAENPNYDPVIGETEAEGGGNGDLSVKAYAEFFSACLLLLT